MTREEIIRKLEPVLSNFFNKKNVDKVWGDVMIDNITDLITEIVEDKEKSITDTVKRLIKSTEHHQTKLAYQYLLLELSKLKLTNKEK